MQYRQRLRIALCAAKICVFEVDLPRQLYTFFENAEVIFGVSGEQILKDVVPFSKLAPQEYRLAVSGYFSHEDDQQVIEEAFKRVLNGEPAVYEARMRAGGSNYVWCRINAIPVVENGVPVRMIGVVTDISDMKKKTDILRRKVNLDAFTGLYNKAHTISLIQDALHQTGGRKDALIVLDIDNFKNYNDTYGHDAGDTIIRAVSQKLRGMFRRTDILGRFGGDEFLIFLRDTGDCRWLNAKLRELTRFEWDGCGCTNSIGVALSPRDGMEFGELFKKADIALYHAKRSKEKFLFYSQVGSL